MPMYLMLFLVPWPHAVSAIHTDLQVNERCQVEGERFRHTTRLAGASYLIFVSELLADSGTS